MQSIIPEIQKQIIKNKRIAIISLFVLIFMGSLVFIANPEGTKELLSSIFGLIALILICYFCAKFCGGGKGRRQSQSQQIIINSGERKRVCPECGMQNDTHSVHCSDCGHKLKKINRK